MGNQSHPATLLLIPASVLKNSLVCCCLLSFSLPPHGPPSASSLSPFIPLTFCLIYFPIALIFLIVSNTLLPSHHPPLFRFSLVSFAQFHFSFFALLSISSFSFPYCIITVLTHTCLIHQPVLASILLSCLSISPFNSCFAFIYFLISSLFCLSSLFLSPTLLLFSPSILDSFSFQYFFFYPGSWSRSLTISSLFLFFCSPVL